MVKQLNKKVNDKIDEINKEIETSEIYQKYLSLKEQIENNKELVELINKVRVTQKDVVHQKKKEKELQELVDELNNHPLYREYNNTLYEINNIYGIIESSLNNYFERIINQEVL